MNADPRVAVAVRVEVMTGAALRVITRVAVPVPVELVAERATLKVPAATLGVPEMRPLVVLMERPPGRPVALKEVGELSAVI
jgi:hypothetical protein